MNLKYLFIAVPTALCIVGNWTAHAGETINEAGALGLVTDKWDEKEVEKALGPVPSPLRVETRCRRASRRVRTLRNTPINTPEALANTRAPRAEARTHPKI
jgi:hypothetical protein